MRALVVEDIDKIIEPRLLLQAVLASRSGGFLLEGPVHALVASVTPPAMASDYKLPH